MFTTLKWRGFIYRLPRPPPAVNLYVLLWCPVVVGRGTAISLTPPRLLQQATGAESRHAERPRTAKPYTDCRAPPWRSQGGST
jgi:hypothetical protein